MHIYTTSACTMSPAGVAYDADWLSVASALLMRVSGAPSNKRTPAAFRAAAARAPALGGSVLSSCGAMSATVTRACV